MMAAPGTEGTTHSVPENAWSLREERCLKPASYFSSSFC